MTSVKELFNCEGCDPQVENCWCSGNGSYSAGPEVIGQFFASLLSQELLLLFLFVCFVFNEGKTGPSRHERQERETQAGENIKLSIPL